MYVCIYILQSVNEYVCPKPDCHYIYMNDKDDSIKKVVLDAKKATPGITTEDVYSEYPIA